MFQNDNFKGNYKQYNHDDLDIEEAFFNDGLPRVNNLYPQGDDSESDDGTLGGEVKVRPRLPPDWIDSG